MADFLSRLVERSFGLMQVAEPLIIPSFAAEPAAIIEHTEASVFDIKPGIRHEFPPTETPFSPIGITQPVAHPDYDTGTQERTAIDSEENNLFEPGLSGQEKSVFKMHSQNQSGRERPDIDMAYVSQQVSEETMRKNEPTVYHSRIKPINPEIHSEIETEVETKNAKIMGVKDKSLPQPESNYLYQQLPEETIMENEPAVHHPRIKPIFPESPVEFDASDKTRRAKIMAHGQKSKHQPENNLDTDILHVKSESLINNLRYTADQGDLLDPEVIDHMDPGMKNNAKKPGNEMHVEDSKDSRSGILRQKEASTDRMLINYEPDLLENPVGNPAIKIGDSYISTQGTSTGFGTPVSKRELRRNASVSINIDHNAAGKYDSGSGPESTTPSIKVNIEHVEIRAAAQPVKPIAHPVRNPVLSLNDYLKKRNGNTS